MRPDSGDVVFIRSISTFQKKKLAVAGIPCATSFMNLGK
jgi:hypothetical protein